MKGYETTTIPPLGFGNFQPLIFADMHIATAGEAIVLFLV